MARSRASPSRRRRTQRLASALRPRCSARRLRRRRAAARLATPSSSRNRLLLAELVATSGQVGQTGGRLKKVELLAACLRQMHEEERAVGARYLAGELPQKTNIGYATVAEVMRQAPPAVSAEL